MTDLPKDTAHKSKFSYIQPYTLPVQSPTKADWCSSAFDIRHIARRRLTNVTSYERPTSPASKWASLPALRALATFLFRAVVPQSHGNSAGDRQSFRCKSISKRCWWRSTPAVGIILTTREGSRVGLKPKTWDISTLLFLVRGIRGTSDEMRSARTAVPSPTSRILPVAPCLGAGRPSVSVPVSRSTLDAVDLSSRRVAKLI